MLMMVCLTILYEMKRGDTCSFLSIMSLLFGIRGVLKYKDGTIRHNAFALVVLSAISTFIFRHCQYGNIRMFWYLHRLLVCLMICIFNKDIFVCEACILLNFAVLYLYLHLKL